MPRSKKIAPESVQEDLVVEMVEFFKALADPARLRIIGLLADQPQCGQELAAALKLSPGTVTHHLRSLKKAGLVTERRDPPYTNYELDMRRMQAVLRSALKKDTVQEFAHAPEASSERRRVLSAFFDGPKLKAIPAQRRKKEFVFEEILRRIPEKDEYKERELSDEIKKIHSDFCTIRREFIMGQYMERERGVYRLTSKGRSVIAEG